MVEKLEEKLEILMEFSLKKISLSLKEEGVFLRNIFSLKEELMSYQLFLNICTLYFEYDKDLKKFKPKTKITNYEIDRIISLFESYSIELEKRYSPIFSESYKKIKKEIEKIRSSNNLFL
ncbi:MAG: hypothetical protein QXG18_01065 [Candidatus Pacearchaeota archaeon]